MNNHIISIFNNKIFFEIIKEAKVFNGFEIKHYDDLNLCIKDAEKLNQIVIFFSESTSDIQNKKFPLILITKKSILKKNISEDLIEYIKMPFKILDLQKKIVSLIAKNSFRKNSLINLAGYIIDKNERKIKKNDLELSLSEKEINFLVLFSLSKEPIDKKWVLKKVWNYSTESETHTVETNIHRLRKKIFKKFNDNNFIKNSAKGYYI